MVPDQMTLLILLYAGLSVLMIALSVPLIQGRVKPNAWYGFRIPLTLNNPDIWYPANRYAGWSLLAYGLVLLVVTLGLPLLLGTPSTEDTTDLYALSVAAHSVHQVAQQPLGVLPFGHVIDMAQVTTQLGGPLHQRHIVTAVGDRESSRHPGHASPDH